MLIGILMISSARAVWTEWKRTSRADGWPPSIFLICWKYFVLYNQKIFLWLPPWWPTPWGWECRHICLHLSASDRRLSEWHSLPSLSIFEVVILPSLSGAGLYVRRVTIREVTFTKIFLVPALFMLLRPYDVGLCKRKCWEMSASTAGFGLKYKGSHDSGTSGSHGSFSHLLLIFQTVHHYMVWGAWKLPCHGLMPARWQSHDHRDGKSCLQLYLGSQRSAGPAPLWTCLHLSPEYDVKIFLKDFRMILPGRP